MQSRLALIGCLLVSGCAMPQAAELQTASSVSEVQLGEGTGALFGTLVRAGSGKSADPVLILAGSGPTDRNGNNPAGVTAQSYRLLAEGLASQGVSSLRVDKRGVAASAAAASFEQDLRIGTFADDARGWARKLRQETGAACVWLLGHSEGTVPALLAARPNKDVCGLVLVSPVGRKMGDILREQLRANPANAPILDEALGIIDRLEAGQTVIGQGMHPALMPLFRPSVQPFLISMMSVDTAQLVRDYPGPVLVVQGTTDIQTSLADARRLGEARPGVRVEIVEGMNHVLKTAPADRAANLATYANPDLPLAPGLIERIVSFIRR
jgi:pimeloyl-ACP methyl ester carboxylesterase